ncbi:set1/Ash2 histone methyltransferase complex subunit ASH2-like isoform X2 [Dysidea avara]|uniref:set1/Ash2 histone methyltransferase complex subunit ASH2-like isoform X2 n=1 Tax=Dysidea avara TaxID=196820 RepID=UPI0033347962
MQAIEENLRVQCGICGKWYNKVDVGVSLKDYIPYMANYDYTCTSCGEETIAKKSASFIQIAITVLANLMDCNSNEGEFTKRFFSIEEEIIPFIDEAWDIICTNRVKSHLWKANVHSKLVGEKQLFHHDNSDPPKFGLVDCDLSTIGPKRYESKPVSLKGGKKKGSGEGGYGFKRRVDTDPDFTIGGTPVAKKPKVVIEEGATSKIHGYPLEHPFNKECYRYIWAEPDPHHVDRDITVEDLGNRPIPPSLYRPIIEPRLMLSLNDRAHQLRVSDDRMTVTGDKGYCVIRANHGIHAGTWYYEVCIDDMAENSAFRLGWSQNVGNLQAPCGFDKFSYSWRSKKGTVFHQSRGKHYSDGYNTGDTLGILIHLPKKSSVANLPSNHKKSPLIKFKGFFYFEEKVSIEDSEKMLHTLKDSKIVFYKNGVCQGTAFKDIYVGTYYPALSIYLEATATVNFGPTFKHPPHNVQYRPMSEAVDVIAVEKLMSDMLYHVHSVSVAARD